jgi:HSP20 family molecular chaperone IbpA
MSSKWSCRFAKTDIEISLAGNKLTVEGATQEEDKNELQDYLFKGIANRNFTRTFNLADKIEIKDAEIVNGMLKILVGTLWYKPKTTSKRLPSNEIN